MTSTTIDSHPVILKADGNSGGPWGGSGGGGGSGSGGSGGGPKHPWGQIPPRRPQGGGGGGGGGKGPSFEDFIRKGQERLRGGLPSSDGKPVWLYMIGAAVVIGLAMTSFYRVEAQERGVVSRFGSYVATTGPGLHFKLPTPIDQVTKVQFEAVSTIEIGSTDENMPNLMLTGDQNIIDIAYAVRWKIQNPERFLYELRDPQETIREVAEAAMRAEMSQVPLNAAIGPQRAQIADQARDRIQEMLDSYRAGIEVLGVDIRQADPPKAVDEAFKDVSAAQQEAEGYLNQARAYSQQLIAAAEGAAAEFDAVYEQYRLSPEVTRKRMYYETMENILSQVDKTVVEAPGVQTYLPLSELRRTQNAPAETTTVTREGRR